MTPSIFSQLHCPFPSEINSHAEAAQQHITEWALNFQFIENDTRFKLANYAWLAARVFPHVNKEHLFLVSDWICWIFLLDDQCDEAIGKNPQQLRELLNELMSVVDQNQHITLENGSRLAASLSDIWTRLQENAPSGWIERYRKTVKNYFEAGYWESTNREKKNRPNINSYIKMRDNSGGSYTVFDLIEITEQLNLSEEVLTNSVFQKLYYLANITTCWTNDIFSYDKEKNLGDIHNLIQIIQWEKNISFERAFAEAISIHNRDMAEYIRLEKELPSFGIDMDNQIQRYLQGLRSFMRGHIDWCTYDTNRFNVDLTG